MRERIAWLAAYVLVLVVAASASYFGAKAASRHADDEIQGVVSQLCRNGNLKSAYELANHSDGPQRSSLVRATEPITNCPATLEAGHIIPVSVAVQNEFVRIVVDQRRWPYIDEDGQIGGTDPLPSSTQRP